MYNLCQSIHNISNRAAYLFPLPLIIICDATGIPSTDWVNSNNGPVHFYKKNKVREAPTSRRFGPVVDVASILPP